MKEQEVQLGGQQGPFFGQISKSQIIKTPVTTGFMSGLLKARHLHLGPFAIRPKLALFFGFQQISCPSAPQCIKEGPPLWPIRFDPVAN